MQRLTNWGLEAHVDYNITVTTMGFHVSLEEFLAYNAEERAKWQRFFDSAALQ